MEYRLWRQTSWVYIAHRHSLNKPSTLPHQGFHTCCTLFLDTSSLKYFHGSFPYFFNSFLKGDLIERSLLSLTLYPDSALYFFIELNTTWYIIYLATVCALLKGYNLHVSKDFTRAHTCARTHTHQPNARTMPCTWLVLSKYLLNKW